MLDVAVGNETSSTAPSGEARAMELLVVPKSMPIEGRLLYGKGMVFQNARFKGREASGGQQHFTFSVLSVSVVHCSLLPLPFVLL